MYVCMYVCMYSTINALATVCFTGLIVGVTGNVLPQDVRDYIQHGADYVMGKPVRINELRQILERIVVV